MFRRVLIANRGEIACRIVATCRRMGLGTVAVFSEADADARHVAMADAAVAIGGPRPADSYLRGEAIIAAALGSGAEAVHPGYGFLAENPDFAEAVIAAGLTWIGPPPAAIRAMGLKDAAKRLMERAGVPVVPGWHGEADGPQDPSRLLEAAEAIGWPLLIKAVAGGGGRGMRRVDAPAGFRAALEGARAEARAAFGDDRVLLERLVAAPRHIEVQVMADGRRAIHLFERDCSLQRRHQKLVEEAPAPGMTDAVRAAMGAAAVRAAEAIGYAGAGTVEFVADAAAGLGPDRFWFIEMNTRLQVEHPVTEAVTGRDLVEWQLRIAAGEGLPCGQDDLRIAGHAVEARLCAEDAGAGFLPATGRIAHLRFPPGVRVDAGVAAGEAVTPHYDPMIAKLVAHAPTRAEALARLADALDRTEIAGVVTNRRFLARLLRHPDVVAGRVGTGLIAAAGAALAADPDPPPAVVAAAALAAAGLWEGGPEHAGFALWAPLVWTVPLVRRGRETAVRLSADPEGGWRLAVGSATVRAVRDAGGWRFDGRRLGAVLHGGQVTVFGPEGAAFALPDPLERSPALPAGGEAVAAPMPGRVARILVAAGAAVAEGAELVVLEAMKMEHRLTAPRAGRVAEVTAAEGAQVAAGQVLLRLAPAAEAAAEAARAQAAAAAPGSASAPGSGSGGG